MDSNSSSSKQQTLAVSSETIQTTLAARGSRYGKFKDHAHITQQLKNFMWCHPNYKALSPSQAEALEMIVHKIGRIINGDPNYHDSWHDIVGYAQLVADELLGIET